LLRHEWAHALAHHHHDLVANREFRQAFDGSHDCGRPVRAYCPTRHISAYAATQPMEDFAENFMHFVKHQGALPAKWQNQHIEKRWNFIHCLAAKIYTLLNFGPVVYPHHLQHAPRVQGDSC
jgi:hypothetical protein